MIHRENIKEPLVTIVLCQKCEKSGHILIEDNRFWCAWCNSWCQAETKQVRNIIYETDSLHPAPATPTTSGLQPLRITPGWKMGHFNHLKEIDLTPEVVQSGYPFHDIMYLRHEQHNRLLDVGWNSVEGSDIGTFILTLWEGDWRGKQLYLKRTNLRTELIEELERLLAQVSFGQI